MDTSFLVIAFVFAALLVFSGVGKLRHDPRIVRVIQDTVGVSLKYFPLLAACEFAGALGLALGVWLPSLAVAAGIGLTLYFVAAVVSHMRVGDIKGVGPAAFMLMLAVATLALRILTRKP